MKAFLLVRPIFCALRNRWRTRIDLRGEGGRDLFLGLFSLVVMAAIYFGTAWALRQANENPQLAFLPPGTFLSLLCAMLFAMLLISATLSSIGSFYLAEDLDLILAAPVRYTTLFCGRFAYVLLVSCWMPFVFSVPVFAAFGWSYSAGIFYYASIPIIMLPFFAVPCALGLVLSTLLVLGLPSSRVRETVGAIIIAGAFGIYLFISSLNIHWDATRSAEEVMRLMSLASTPQLAWLPSHWVAAEFDQLLRSQTRSSFSYLVMLWSTAVAAVSLAYVVLLSFHDLAFSKIRNKRIQATHHFGMLQRLLRTLGAPLSPSFKAIIGKEFRVLSRDIGQTVQLLFLLGLCVLYLYHVRVFAAVESFPENIRPWWRNFLFIGNLAMGAFVTTAICTRFVFPSLSLEGRSYWILQTAPIGVAKLLRMKFWCWFIPVATISTIFFTMGAVSIGVRTSIIVYSALGAIVICYGIVGLAIGFGAIFAFFEWEHASQLAGGLGSLLFMLGATALIFLNLIPVWILLFYPSIPGEDQTVHTALAVTNALAIVGLNIYGAEVAIRSGVKAIEKRRA